MRAFILVLVASIGAGCAARGPQLPDSAPRGESTPRCAEGQPSAPNSLVLRAAGPVKGGVDQLVLVYLGRYSERELVVPVGAGLDLPVRPVCGIVLPKSIFSLFDEKTRTIGDLDIGRDYTVLAFSCDGDCRSHGVIGYDARNIRVDANRRPRLRDVGAWQQIVFNELRVPYTRVPIRPLRFRARINF